MGFGPHYAKGSAQPKAHKRCYDVTTGNMPAEASGNKFM